MRVWGPASAKETGIAKLHTEHSGRACTVGTEVGVLVAAGVDEPGGVLAANALFGMRDTYIALNYYLLKLLFHLNTLYIKDPATTNIKIFRIRCILRTKDGYYALIKNP